MSSDDKPDILPPSRTQLPQPQRAPQAPTLATEPLPRPSGVVGSLLTGWQADSEAKAHASLAKRVRAQSDHLKARGELADQFVSTSRSVDRLRDVGAILENDAANRHVERTLQSFDREDALAARRRQRELEAARHAAELADLKRLADEAEQRREVTERLQPLRAQSNREHQEAALRDAERELDLRARREVLDEFAAQDGAPTSKEAIIANLERLKGMITALGGDPSYVMSQIELLKQ
jgi:hypothetical protein